MEPLGSEEGEGGGTSVFATALVLYLTYVDLGDPRQAAAFPEIVQGLVALAHRVLDDDARHEVACALLDPTLVFISPDVEEMVPGLVAALDQ
ncbi:MAG TPA: hypothetical protein PKK06_16740 [Phycisphaerae bacterium]|nr:hypothetical protein [Phycisphaerae bacterium]